MIWFLLVLFAGHVCARAGFLVVDNKEYTGHSSGRHVGLDIGQNMFLGGVPDYQTISPHAAQRSGFIGKILCFMGSDSSTQFLCLRHR